jgi:energy-coupling factor transport system substrate-specific component
MATMGGTMMERKSMWEFGTRQVVYGAIGAALYGVLSWVTNFVPLPAAGNVTFRPAVAVLVFFGVAYGPWVGFLAGLFGNILGDAISGFGFYWNWSLGNGLMGLLAGMAYGLTNFRSGASIVKAIIWSVIGIAVGMLFASLTEMITSGIDMNTALVGYFAPAFLGNLVVTVILLPILMIAFAGVAAGRGR